MLTKKFLPAFHGLRDAWGHPAVRIQIILGILAVIAGFVLNLTILEWAFVVFAIGLVIGAEVFNTCIEKLCDLHSTEYDHRIEVIKDMSAGGVLIAALTALVIAVMILLEHLN